MIKSLLECRNMVTLLSQTQETINYYKLEVEGQTVCVREYLDDRGKVIDATFKNEEGGNIFDPTLIETVESFLDENFPA